jgi:metal-dependent amidase/aminoacylase/carboxypeptidase family protein
MVTPRGRWVLTVLLALTTLPAGTAPAAAPLAADAALLGDIDRRVADATPALLDLYRYIHSHPELSLQEQQTAARLAHELEGTGFEVTPRVGGYGLVAVLKNGPGPTVLVRTDMDALPVVEQTGLPYASKVRARDRDGKDVGVMHACGHDMHMRLTNGW